MDRVQWRGAQIELLCLYITLSIILFVTMIVKCQSQNYYNNIFKCIQLATVANSYCFGHNIVLL